MEAFAIETISRMYAIFRGPLNVNSQLLDVRFKSNYPSESHAIHSDSKQHQTHTNKENLVKEFNKPLPDVGHIPCYCNHCHNQSAYAIRTINCVTLFFIPVLPFYFTKRLKCSICGTNGQIDDTAIDRLRQGQPVMIG
ncbi:uncharacterized protein J8A68_001858 [[Candida] subhashii]|uniref:Zinc-ribbon 15 domain-containing protein n=1 Tax=[Candida] subhashii TaxID=561895 RepID=A0A8J5QM52_9ASCO|nr:uncharacterized protein J8A68_001858 [[Candida] subhashii]KAG7664633.1 hypothetical protein J8A68_001858 [[Candida] subhashii]